MIERAECRHVEAANWPDLVAFGSTWELEFRSHSQVLHDTAVTKKILHPTVLFPVTQEAPPMPSGSVGELWQLELGSHGLNDLGQRETGANLFGVKTTC